VRSIVIRELTLRDMIARLREELFHAEEERPKIPGARSFRIDSVTLEVKLVAAESAGRGGGIDFRVVSASEKASYAEQQIHKVTVSLRNPDVN
jgi:hypothetical protein